VALSTGGYGKRVRHNFVNDIGDYAKYALLRALCAGGQPGVRLGVIWYLTEHVERNNDGRKRAHLVTTGWEDLDPDLLARMRQVEDTVPSPDRLNVSLIEAAGILPPGTAYFSEPLPCSLGTAQQRIAQRADWFERARKAVADCDLAFLDPDNGLEVRSVPVTSPLSAKYATVAEVAALLQPGAGVVLYQHGSRTPWHVQRERVCAQIAAGAGRAVTIRSLRFGAFGSRAFFCITSDRRISDIVEYGLGQLRQRAAGWDKSRYLLIELSQPRSSGEDLLSQRSCSPRAAAMSGGKYRSDLRTLPSSLIRGFPSLASLLIFDRCTSRRTESRSIP
jgi:hypothetical protein